MQNKTAVITVSDNLFSYIIFLPNHGSPDSVAGVLLAVSPRLKDARFFSAGQVAADIVSAIDPLVRASLLGEVVPADYHYAFCNTFTEGPTVGVSDHAKNHLFDGPLYKFTDWAQTVTGLEWVVAKVVQFKYDGGSTPGAVRTVRVDKVGKEEEIVFLEGYDLAKMDLKHAYRRYHNDKVRELVVVN